MGSDPSLGNDVASVRNLGGVVADLVALPV